jgi:hypothetical protein
MIPAKRNNMSHSVDDQHEHFIVSLRSRLSSLVSSDPLLSRLSSRVPVPSRSQTLPIESAALISISVRRFDQSLLRLDLPENATLFQLTKAIEQQFLGDSIHWKSIWKRYQLMTDDQQLLIHRNRSIKSSGVVHNSQLMFVRRRRSP